MPSVNPSFTARLAVILVSSLAGLAAHAQQSGTSSQPKLVVGVLVEGLQYDVLDNLRPYFTDGGFNRLFNEGVVLSNVDYGTSLDAVAATAVAVTGASPSVNGINSSMAFDTEAKRISPSLLDPEFIGNATSETYSPRNLLVSTLADETRIAGGGVTNVYAIAPEPQTAVVLGGHAANSVFWINDNSGNWATTTFYRDAPFIVSGRNRLNPLSARLDTLSWTPSAQALACPDVPDYLKHFPFKYNFARTAPDRYAMFKNSALVNAEVTSLATEFINALALGTHDGPDMINVAYTLSPYQYTRNRDTRLETTDSYIRLDRDLDSMFKAADRASGGNAVIWLFATPPATTVRRDDETWNIPYGEFSTRKAGSLLNMYLMAVHGTGEWVKGYHNGHFYLNNALIKEKGLDAKSVRRDAASFVARMSGVREVFTIDQIVDGIAGDNAHALKRNTNLRTAGDIYLNVIPGWEIINDYAHGSTGVARNIVERIAPATAPAFILAPSVAPRRIDIPVDARILAPTVARLLRIRSPNAAATPAIDLD